MIDQQSGVIINTSSMWGVSHSADRTAYCATTAAVVSMTKCLAVEWARHGIRLSEEDRRRRYLIKSLLKAEGLECHHYRQVFGSAPQADFPDLERLQELELARIQGPLLRLTEAGMACSDLIGHWFIGPEVQQKMREYQPR